MNNMNKKNFEQKEIKKQINLSDILTNQKLNSEEKLAQIKNLKISEIKLNIDEIYLEEIILLVLHC